MTNITSIVTKNAPKTSIYMGPSTITPTSKSQIYGTYTTPYYSCTLTYTLFAANSVEFESPNFYNNMSRVNIIGEHKSFGGQVVENKETQNGYTYTCLDYNRLLFGKWGYHFTNIRVSDIIKMILVENGFPTNGIMTSPTIHSSLAASPAKEIDLIHQLANIEGLEFFINQDGIPILRETPQSTMGYVFVVGESVSDYNIDLNDNAVVTSVQVFGADGEYLYNYSNSSMTAKYGDITDILDDSNLTDADEAKISAEQLFKDDNSGRFTCTITIPKAIDIGEGEWCIFVPPKGSNLTTKAYYTQEVQVKISSTEESTTITCLDGKPPIPSEWIYIDPITNMATVCTATSGGNSNSVCASAKPSVGGSGLAYRNYVSCFEDECPICGKTLRWNPKHVPEGEWTCLDDDDFCAVTGKKKIKGSNVYLKRLSGPTPTNQPVGQVASPSSNNMNCTSGTATGIAARLPPTVKTPCQVYQWIRDNVSYSYYWDSHHGENPTAAAKYILDAAPNGKANCDDQALAAVALLNGLGYSARRVHTSCAGMGHYHVIVRVNGADRVFDTTCTGESQIRGCAY